MRPRIDTHGRPIILVGLMGCGKTTVGRELSKMLGMPFLDMDAVIEEQIGKSIPAIFRDEGEAHFRALETALLRYIATKAGSKEGADIVSTGGGVVLKPENRDIIRRLGFSVWLNVEVPALMARTARSTNRPLLAHADRRATLERLSRERSPLYAASAHLRIDSTFMDVVDVVDAICAAASTFFNPPLGGDQPSGLE